MSLINSLYYLMNPILVVVVIVLRLNVAHGNAHICNTNTHTHTSVQQLAVMLAVRSTYREIEANVVDGLCNRLTTTVLIILC